MKKILTITFALVLLFTLRLAAVAGEQDFTLVNATGHTIDALYVSPSASDDWEEDILGQATLADGQSATIKFNRAATAAKWDIKIVDEEKKEIEWKGFDLPKINKITLHYKGSTPTADFE